MERIHRDLKVIGAYLNGRHPFPEKFPLFELLGLVYWSAIQLERMTHADKTKELVLRKDWRLDNGQPRV